MNKKITLHLSDTRLKKKNFELLKGIAYYKKRDEFIIFMLKEVDNRAGMYDHKLNRWRII